MRVELEHGQWATFRDDVEEISNRDRRPVEAAIGDETLSRIQRSQRAVHLLLVWLVSGWSLTDSSGAPRPLPREDADVLEEIRGRDYDLLMKAADDQYSRAFVRFSVTPGDADPNLRGGSSNGSAGGLKADPSTPAAPSPPAIVTGSSSDGSAGT